jgi:hypothetical protein
MCWHGGTPPVAYSQDASDLISHKHTFSPNHNAKSQKLFFIPSKSKTMQRYVAAAPRDYGHRESHRLLVVPSMPLACACVPVLFCFKIKRFSFLFLGLTVFSRSGGTPRCSVDEDICKCISPSLCCAKHRVLTKEPVSKEINKTDKLPERILFFQPAQGT